MYQTTAAPNTLPPQQPVAPAQPAPFDVDVPAAVEATPLGLPPQQPVAPAAPQTQVPTMDLDEIRRLLMSNEAA
jgi:hypothetical protein